MKKFKTNDMKWASFIMDCRLGILHNYDIVTGYVSDGKIVLIVNDLHNKKITKNICKAISPKKLTDTQISFHSQKGISCIKYIK